MKSDDKIKDEKLQHNIHRDDQKYQLYHLEKLVNMNFLQLKKYYFLIKEE